VRTVLHPLASTVRAVIGGEIQATHSRRRVADAAFLERTRKAIVHEPLLRLPGIPDFEDDPAARLRAAGLKRQARRQSSWPLSIRESAAASGHAADVLGLQGEVAVEVTVF
jgi:hypothetical protein